MNLLRNRLHTLIDQLSDEELAEMKAPLKELYCDLYMLRAAHVSKRTLNPGDTFTREEALQFLSHP